MSVIAKPKAEARAMDVEVTTETLEVALTDGRRVSVPEFVEKALAAQTTAVLSDPYLEARAKRADGRVDEAPDAPPLPGDERQ